MDRLIYTAASGARALTMRQDGIAQNLANANTTGFRADLVGFRAVPVRGDGATTRVHALEVTTGFDSQSGPLQATGRNLDAAIKGEGYFAVQGADGLEAYTRSGAFEVSADGALVTQSGRPVVGEGGALTIPADSIVSISGDGTVSAKPTTGPNQVVGRLKLVNPPASDLQKGSDGLLRMRNGDEAPSASEVRVAPEALEGSNVNAIEAMVDMIAAARQFETQMKLLQSAEQNDQRASQLLAAVR